MSLVPDTVKLANVQEQIDSVLANIRTANIELKDLYDKRDEALAQLGETQEELAQAQDDLKQTLKDLATRRLQAKELFDKLTIKERNLEADKKDFANYKEEQTRRLKDELALIKIDIKFWEECRIDITNSIDDLHRQLTALEAETTAAKELRDRTREELGSIESSLRDKRSEMNAILNDLSKDIQLKREEYLLAHSEVEKEKEKIKRPMELLEEANAYVERKQRNLNIMVKRFTKEFKKLHPDLDIRI